MNYLKGAYQDCQAYNDTVYNADESMKSDPKTTAYASIIERDGNHYIRKHPDYPATAGLIEANLPEPDSDELI